MAILKTTGIISNKYVADPNANAAAYIALIEAAGATVTDPQKTILSEFYTAAEAAGYYSSLKRLYFPIWGVAAANAIDLIGGTSGTFNGGVTHGAGFVQGNGSTGYFDLVTNPNSVGMSISSAFLVAGVYTLETTIGFECQIGGQQGPSNSLAIFQNPYILDCGDEATNRLNSAAGAFLGIHLLTQVGSNKVFNKRISSGFSTVDSLTATPAGNIPTLMTAMSRNGTGGFSDNKMAFYGMGSGLAQPEAEAFTLALKNMWESLTGLTLP
jgi:hypothetical protein